MTEAVGSATLAAVRRTLALAVLLFLAATACGGGDEDTLTIEATPAAMQEAAEETLDAGTGRFETTMTMEVMGQTITMEFTGAFDGPAGLQSAEVDMGSLLDGVGGEDLPPGVAAGLGGPMEMVIDGEIMYVCWDLLETVAGSRCGSLNFTDATGVPLPAGNSDPTSFTYALAGAHDVEEVGTDTVDGVETQHFQGNYMLASALEELDPEHAAALEASFEQIGADAEDLEYPFDAWVDADNHVRRIVFEFDIAGVSASIDQHYFDFGADVDIQVPEGDIADLTSLFEQADAGGG